MDQKCTIGCYLAYDLLLKQHLSVWKGIVDWETSCKAGLVTSGGKIVNYKCKFGQTNTNVD